MSSDAAKPKGSTGAPSSRTDEVEGDDYSIFPSMDRIRESSPWRIASYGDDGALTEPQVLEIAERFDLDAGIVRTLSRQLGYCLDSDSVINLVEVNRSVAIKRANQKLSPAVDAAKRANDELGKVADLAAHLSPDFSANDADAALLPSVVSKIERMQAAAEGLVERLEVLLATPGAAAVMAPRDKRKVRDMRRKYVVDHCCHAWRDAGRKMTFTTIADNDDILQRQGPLLDFIQAVATRVTEPSTELSVETIRNDIDRFREHLKDPDGILGEPDIGRS